MYKFKILDVISKNPGFSQRHIANSCGISIGKVNYMINELSLEGCLEIERNGKSNRYLLTPKGKEYLIQELIQIQDRKISINHSSSEKPIKEAVILAAGKREHFDKPAGLLDIHGTTLMERTIKILEENGIEKIIIVTGYQKESFEECKDIKDNKNIILVDNPRYLWDGSMASLQKASEYITDDFILIEDDILIEEQAVKELFNHQKRDCLLMTKESGSGDEAFIEIRNGKIHQLSKDIHSLNRIDGEMVGITKISYEVWQEMLKLYQNNQNPYINYEYVLLDVSRRVDIGFFKISDIIWSEIDTKEQYLKVLDITYTLLQVKEEEIREDELKQLIADSLEIPKDSVTSIQPLGGLTNRNYKMVIKSKEYAVRIPGKGTEKYLDRSLEKIVSEKTSKLGINPEILYFNESTGLKIVEFIPDAETLNPKTGKREDNLRLVAGTFRTLHTSGEDFVDCFDIFEKLDEYERVLKSSYGRLFERYEEVKSEVLQLKDYYQSLNVPLAPCHIDPLAENFVKSGEKKMYLIDWEYAGMNDPFWDIAAYIIEAELSPAEEQLFLMEYFNGDLLEENLQRLLLNKIFLDFLWTVWALMKEAEGEDFRSYAYNRFVRAQKNLKFYRDLQEV